MVALSITGLTLDPYSFLLHLTTILDPLLPNPTLLALAELSITITIIITIIIAIVHQLLPTFLRLCILTSIR